jgi:DNA-binding MarR family transcriptional regulator
VNESPDLSRADLDGVPVGRLLALTGRLLSARFQRFLDAEGLSHSGWLVLMKLGDADGLTQREVADRCYVTQATVTGVVDTLERDGLVVRERGTDDRRVVRVRLTDTGRSRLAKAKATVHAEMAPLFADLTAREEAVVRRFLTRTVRRLGAETGESNR